MKDAVARGKSRQLEQHGRCLGIAGLAAHCLALLATSAAAQSPGDDFCTTRWVMRGEELLRVEVEHSERVAYRDFRLGGASGLVAYPLPSFEASGMDAEAPLWLLALASGGGPLGDIDRIAWQTRIPTDQSTRRTALRRLARDSHRAFTAWSPVAGWLLLIQQRQAEQGFVASHLVEEFQGPLREWRAPRGANEQRQLQAALPQDCEPVLSLRVFAPETVDAFHMAMQSALSNTFRTALKQMGGSLSPARAQNAQFAREHARAAAFAWANHFGCWRLHEVAIGRRGEQTLISICADVDLDRVVGFAEWVGSLRHLGGPEAVDHEKPFARWNYGSFDIAIGKDHLALQRAWDAPCHPARATFDTRDFGFTLELRGSATFGHRLGGFARATLACGLDSSRAQLAFESSAQRDAWLAALERQVGERRNDFHDLLSSTFEGSPSRSSADRLVFDEVSHEDLITLLWLNAM